MPKAEDDKPEWVEDRKDSKGPKCKESGIIENELIWGKLCRTNDIFECTEFGTESNGSEHAMPKAEDDKPGQVEDREDGRTSKCKESSISRNALI